MTRFDPRIKPERGTYRLNREHSLSRGLVGLWLFNEGGGRIVENLADTRYPGIMQNPVGGNSSLGWGPVGWTGDGDTGMRWCKSTCFPGVRLTLSAGFITSTNSTTQGLLCKDFFDSGGTRTWQFRIGPAVEFIFIQPGVVVATGGTTITTNVPHVASATYDGSHMKIWLDGRLDGSVVETNDPPSNTSQTPNIAIGAVEPADTGVNGGHFQGTIMWASVHSRSLNASEILLMHDQPYCMLEPVRRRRTYSISSAISRLLMLRRKAVAA